MDVGRLFSFMTLSETEYNELVRFAERGVEDAGHIDAKDLVNDILLEILERGGEIDLVECKRRIRNGVLNKKVNDKQQRPTKGFGKNDTSKHCSKCKEDIPLNGFRFHTNRYGVWVCYQYCKDCQVKNIWKCKKKRMENPGVREKVNEYLRQWRKKNPTKARRIAERQKEKRRLKSTNESIHPEKTV
jgi:hypothetical protein